MTSVLLTGATGFIGQAVQAALAWEDVEVHTVSRRDVDLLDETAMRSYVGRIRADVLVHLAWCADPARFWTDPENLTWARRSISLLEAFIENGGGAFVGAGTCAEYFAMDTPYAAAKASFWREASRLCARRGVRAVWARIFYAFGPGEAHERLLSAALMRLVQGELVVLREPESRLDYVYVADVGRAFAKLTRCSEASGEYDVGMGQARTVMELVRQAAAVAGLDGRLVVGGVEAGSIRMVVADTARLRTVGWAPEMSLSQGIARLWSGLRSELQ